jgi:hypothetical protein
LRYATKDLKYKCVDIRSLLQMKVPKSLVAHSLEGKWRSSRGCLYREVRGEGMGVLGLCDGFAKLLRRLD